MWERFNVHRYIQLFDCDIALWANRFRRQMRKHYPTNCLIDTFFAYIFAFVSFCSTMPQHMSYMYIVFDCWFNSCVTKKICSDNNVMWKRCQNWYAKSDPAIFHWLSLYFLLTPMLSFWLKNPLNFCLSHRSDLKN